MAQATCSNRLPKPAVPDNRSRKPARASQQTAAPFQRRLVVMVKTPVMGRVKTRLGRQVGAVVATSFYRHTAAAVLGRVAADPRWQTVLAVAPDTGLAGTAWPSVIRRLRQGSGDLGARMQRIFDQAPPGPLIIIGTDIPGIDTQHIARAFRQLGAADAVLGPAPDGGYWLVGLRRSPRVLRVFGNVRWSSADTLADTVANLPAHHVALADILGDVDSAADLALAGGRFGRRIQPAF